MLQSEVRNEIAESINVLNSAYEAITMSPWLNNRQHNWIMNDPSKRGRQCSLRQPGSRRGKQISTIERVSDGPETVLVALDCPHLHFLFLAEDVREQPIVGAEKKISGGI